jgi:pyruvate/2-oxoglutarate dehydrogenase complex dihydrolipoamide acyltransferase (E2) component
MKIENITTASTKELISFYNANSGRPLVKKFADRKTAEARVKNVIESIAKSEPAKVEKTESVKQTKAPKAERGIVGAGTNREVLFNCLTARINKMVPMSQLMIAVYGDANKSNKSKLMMVMKGINFVIASKGLPFTIKKVRENKENHFGLFDA